MKNLTPVLILAAISILLWAVYFILKKSQGKKTPQYFKEIAEKYGLVYDDSNKIGYVIYPLISGVYKNRHSALGCLSQGASGNKDGQTYIRVECSNPQKLSLLLLEKNKKNPVASGENTVKLMDSEFDEKFIVSSNSPLIIFPIFTFNIKYSLLQAQNLGFRGELKLADNLLDYTEPGMVKDENSRTRIELLLHIMCDIAGELEKL